MAPHQAAPRPTATNLRLRPAPIDVGAEAGRSGATATLLRRTVFIPPALVRPYFIVCAVEGWRRVPVEQLVRWSGIPVRRLKRRLAAAGLTPAGVAAWNLALHAAWLLDVAELSAGEVVRHMRLGRHAALGAILGGRAVPFHFGRIPPGAFTATLDRYLEVLHAAFRV
jgi:hypothetical protein